jgi:hypothetical protein
VALVAVVLVLAGCGSGSHHPSPSASAKPARTTATSPQPVTVTSVQAAPSATTSAVASGYPDASSTGVPVGTVLTTYHGPTELTKCGTVINAKIIRANLDVDVGNKSSSPNTPCVTIVDSILIGTVNTGPDPGKLGPLVLRHVEVAPPPNSLQQGVIGSNFYLYNVNIHGGANGGVDCAGYCGVYDSWIHDFYLAGATHYDGIMTNGLYNNTPMTIEHNTIDCDFYAQAAGATGGCSADVGLYGDFAPTSYVSVERNLFVASLAQAYCFYGGAEQSKKFPNPTHVVVTDNTFQRGSNGKCANFGPVAYYASGAPGNDWSGNVWNDGGELSPPPD